MVLCPYCDRTADDRINLTSHLRRTHSCDHTPAELASATFDARDIEDVPDVHERLNTSPLQGAKISTIVADNNDRLRQVGQDIKDMKAQAEEVATRLAVLDAGLVRPKIVRLATLEDVKRSLTEAGYLQAAAHVELLIKRTAQAGDQ